MSDMKFTPSPGKLKLTSLACACLGTLTILGLGLCVSTCVSALSPGSNQPVYAADSTQQVDLSDPNIRVTYGVDGTMYVDIYVNDKDNFDLTGVNVNGGQSESSDPLDHGGENDGKSSSTTESNNSSDNKTEEQLTESTTEQSDNKTEEQSTESSDNKTEDEGSTNNDISSELGNNDTQKPSNGNSSMTDEEREILSSGKYLDTDKVYIVVRGDTLTEISNEVGFSVDFLAAYNHIENPNLIYASESLRYPSLN